MADLWFRTLVEMQRTDPPDDRKLGRRHGPRCIVEAPPAGAAAGPPAALAATHSFETIVRSNVSGRIGTVAREVRLGSANV
jgi:hypothetical protein